MREEFLVIRLQKKGIPGLPSDGCPAVSAVFRFAVKARSEEER